MKTAMIKYPTCLLFLFAFILLNAVFASAQHCPFDGRHLIVVELTNANGQLVTAAPAGKLQLGEINQPVTAACTYAEGILNKPFESPLEIFKSFNYYKPSMLTDDFCKGCTFLKPGYYAVNLNQAEETCMIKKATNDFDYRKREYEVRYSGSNFSRNVIVPKDRIYELCTARGKWSRIIPVKLQITE